MARLRGVFAGLLSSFIIVGSVSGAETKLPDSELGIIMTRWLELIERGDGAEIERFVEETYSAPGRRENPAAAEMFLRLHRQTGGLDVLEVTPPTDELPMRILARSRKGNLLVRVMAGLDSTEAGRLRGIGVSRAPDPDAPKLSEQDPPSSVEARIAAIRSEVERRVAEGTFSGVVLVAQGDRILFHGTYGMADVENERPITKETTFHLASVGKMFTAVSIAQLVKKGKLSYEQTVAEVLPDLADHALGRVTIQQLLQHTSGMGTFFGSPGFDPDRTWQTALDEMAVYLDERLAFEPGERWRYSNAGYSLLGAVIETVSGTSYLEYIRRNVLEPLGMRSTDRNGPGEVAPSAAVLYTPSDRDPLGFDSFEPNRKIRSSHATGFGDGSSNALDLLRFARAYRNDRLPGDVAVGELFAEIVPDGGGPGSGYGYGVKERLINGAVVRGHSGGGRTDVQMLWESDWTVIVQTNQVPPPATALSNEILGFLSKAPARSSPEPQGRN